MGPSTRSDDDLPADRPAHRPTAGARVVRLGLTALALAWGWDLVSGVALLGLGVEGLLNVLLARGMLLGALAVLWFVALRRALPGLAALAVLGGAELALALWMLAGRWVPGLPGTTGLLAVVVLWSILVYRGTGRLGPGARGLARGGATATAVVLRVVGGFAEILTLASFMHSDAMPLPEMAPYLVAPDTAAVWETPGEGYLVVSRVPADDPGVVALAAHRDGTVVAVESPLTAGEVTELVRSRAPRFVAFVLPADETGTARIHALNRGLFADGEAPCAFGVLPAEGLADYVARVAAVERALAAAGDGVPGRVVTVAEKGRQISSFCEVAAQGFARALGAGATMVHDNTASSRLMVHPGRRRTLAEAELLLLLGHGTGSTSAGLFAGDIPEGLSARLVVNGTCYGGDPGSPVARTFHERGALLQVGGTDITGWMLVAGALPHLFECGLPAGEGFRRAMNESRRAVETGAVESSLGALGAMYGVSLRGQLDETLLIGDPAFVPFPRRDGEERADLAALTVAR